MDEKNKSESVDDIADLGDINEVLDSNLDDPLHEVLDEPEFDDSDLEVEDYSVDDSHLEDIEFDEDFSETHEEIYVSDNDEERGDKANKTKLFGVIGFIGLLLVGALIYLFAQPSNNATDTSLSYVVKEDNFSEENIIAADNNTQVDGFSDVADEIVLDISERIDETFTDDIIPSEQSKNIGAENTIQPSLVSGSEENIIEEVLPTFDQEIIESGNNNDEIYAQQEALRERLSEIVNSLESVTKRLDVIEGRIENIAKANVVKKDRAQVSIKKLEKATSTQNNKLVKADSAKNTRNVKWAIRAIQVGKAVIANVETGETRNIEAGQIIPGLGKISAITYKDGGWVIDGSQRSLKQ